MCIVVCLQLQAQIADLQTQLVESSSRPDMRDAAVQAAGEAILAEAAAAAATPAPAGCQFAGVQCPTPAVPSPGIGVQFPTPAVPGASGAAAAGEASLGQGMGADAAAAAAAGSSGAGTGSGVTHGQRNSQSGGSGGAPSLVPKFPNLSPLSSSAAAAAAAAVAAAMSGGAEAAGQHRGSRASMSKGSGSPVKGLVTAACHRQQDRVSLAPGASSGAAAAAGGAAGAISIVDVIGAAAVPLEAGAGSGGSCGSGAGSGGLQRPAPYHTPGGINAFMFATASDAEAAGANATRHAGAGAAGAGAAAAAGEFTFDSPQRPLGRGAAANPQQQMAFPGMDGLQGSDNGSCIVSKRQSAMFGAHSTLPGAAAGPSGAAAAAGGAALQVGMAAGRLSGFGAQLAGAMGTPAMPAAPHNTPVGPGESGGFSTPGGTRGQQQQNSPALSTASRVRIREQGLQQIRQQLMAGIGGRPDAAAPPAPAAVAPAAASPGAVGNAANTIAAAAATGGAAAAGLAPAVSPAKFAVQRASMRPIEMSPGANHMWSYTTNAACEAALHA
jgi:hypothetical protein